MSSSWKRLKCRSQVRARSLCVSTRSESDRGMLGYAWAAVCCRGRFGSRRSSGRSWSFISSISGSLDHERRAIDQEAPDKPGGHRLDRGWPGAHHPEGGQMLKYTDTTRFNELVISDRVFNVLNNEPWLHTVGAIR